MQELLTVLKNHVVKIDMRCNVMNVKQCAWFSSPDDVLKL